MLRDIAPTKAKALITSAELPEDEYYILHQHDIKRRPLDIIADELHVSPRQAKHIHRRGLIHILDFFGDM